MAGEKDDRPLFSTLDDDDDDDDGGGPTMVHDSARRIALGHATKRAYLLVVGGAGSLGKLVPVQDGMVIGRARDCDLVLEEDGVSRHHSKLVLLPGGVCKITDLDSSNGVRIDGTKTHVHALRDGERIRLGGAVLTLLHLDGDEEVFRRNLIESLEALARGQ